VLGDSADLQASTSCSVDASLGVVGGMVLCAYLILVISLWLVTSFSFTHLPVGSRRSIAQQQRLRLQIFARRSSGTKPTEPKAYTSVGAPLLEAARPAFTNNNITYSNKRVDIDWHSTLPTSSSSSAPVPRSKPVSRKVEERIAQVLIRKGEFSSGGKMITSRIEEIEEACRALNSHSESTTTTTPTPMATTSTSITIQQALSLRKQLLVSKIKKDSWRVHHDLQKLIDRYTKQNKSLIDLAREFDLPPVAIFRAILGSRVRKHWPALLDRDVR